jgi:hypothetical protein
MPDAYRCAALDALSDVFPGRCRGEGLLLGSPRGRGGSPRHLAADDEHRDAARLYGHEPDLRGRTWLAPPPSL